jgi:hypothetical protein
MAYSNAKLKSSGDKANNNNNNNNNNSGTASYLK